MANRALDNLRDKKYQFLFQCPRFCIDLLKHVPLTLKMLLTTVLVGFIVWAVMDHFQTSRINTMFNEHVSEDLSREAEKNRGAFDEFINAHRISVETIISQKQLIDYVNGRGWKARIPLSGAVDINEYKGESPPWFPSSRALRSLVHFRYALLLDSKGRAREIYSADSRPVPGPLLKPSGLLLRSSHEQNILADIEGVPYVISSDSLIGSGGHVLATLMIACPIDDELVRESVGAHDSGQIVSLIDPLTSRVIASNKPQILSRGVMAGSLNDKYHVMGRSLIGNSASGLKMELVSFIPIEEYESLGRSILYYERRNRALTAMLLISVFAIIGIWITRRVQKLSDRVVKTSRAQLGIELANTSYADQIDILEKQFNRLTAEVAASRDSLLKEKRNLEVAHEELIIKNWEVDESRMKLQKALDGISSLIQEASHGKGFSVRSINHITGNCYDLLLCNKPACPCYGRESVKCWEEAGTLCGEHVDEKIDDKLEACPKCLVFMEISSDPVYRIGEHFNNMMHILENKNKELEKAYEDLKATQSTILQQEKMASIGQLAAGVAHEINNPIGFITSNLGTLEKYVAKFTEFIRAQSETIASVATPADVEGLNETRKKLKLDHVMEDVTELIKESLDGAGRVKTIVQDLKSFSRVDESMHKQADINECIESTLNIVWNELKYKTTVKKEYGDIPMTKCYPQQLNQVFMNLLVNAAQAIEKQGEITIRTSNGDGSIYVAVSDTGSGIPADKLGRIFEPFFTTKEVGKGTGLGLSITYDIVKKHNGEIMVDSEVGKGTTFTIRIPVVEGQ